MQVMLIRVSLMNQPPPSGERPSERRQECSDPLPQGGQLIHETIALCVVLVYAECQGVIYVVDSSKNLIADLQKYHNYMLH